MDTKSLISCNIIKNDNVEVIVRTTTVVDENENDITETKIVDEKDKDEES